MTISHNVDSGYPNPVFQWWNGAMKSNKNSKENQNSNTSQTHKVGSQKDIEKFPAAALKYYVTAWSVFFGH